jgi:hypothetical protein
MYADQVQALKTWDFADLNIFLFQKIVLTVNILNIFHAFYTSRKVILLNTSCGFRKNLPFRGTHPFHYQGDKDRRASNKASRN